MTRLLLVATYELGHQPTNLARPAALLAAAGHEVRTIDTSVEPWDPALVAWADAVAVSVPMHTATRLARDLLATVEVPTCCYGLYAHLCADMVDRVISGEYETALVAWATDLSTSLVAPDTRRGNGSHTSHTSLNSFGATDSDDGDDSALFPPRAVSTTELGRVPGGGTEGPTPLPRRWSLPPLDRYAYLMVGGTTGLAASVETTRGCAHRCRHCPVPVVYDGRVRVQDEAALLADVDQLAAAGATHLSFGDPDFLNAPAHALRIVRAVHAAHPHVTFDATVKVEHVLDHRDLWPELAASGCLFVVSAFESLDGATLERLDKGHTAADAAEAVGVLRAHGIGVRPSFLPFTPWTTRDQLVALLDFVHEHDLVDRVDPVQYTIRLLLPPGSLLLDHPDTTPHVFGYDPNGLTYRWTNPDPAIDDLQRELAALVETFTGRGAPTTLIYEQVRARVGAPAVDLTDVTTGTARLSESWFCCAEPTSSQRQAVQPTLLPLIPTKAVTT